MNIDKSAVSKNFKESDISTLQNMANSLRILSVDAIQQANSGHPGMPLGMADVVAVLSRYFLNINAEAPEWLNRDQLVFSAGHGSALLYSLLHLMDYKKISLDSLKKFRQLNSITAGHPEFEIDAGIECSTGPLGHGLAMAVGMAIVSKKLAAKFAAKNIINHKVYTIAGDGCLMEGVSYEAVALAGHLNLNNLVIIWDDNGITIDGKVSITSSEDQKARFQANGFKYIAVNGHDYKEIYEALLEAQASEVPVIIAAKTKIGFGSPTKEGTSSVHGSPLGQEEIKGLRQKLGWNSEPFVIPSEVRSSWQISHNRVKENYQKWLKEFNSFNKKEELIKFVNKDFSQQKLNADLSKLAAEILQHSPSKATRVSSLDVLNVISENIPNLISGSADLAASVMTKPKNVVEITKNNYDGNYINYGIREHAMGVIMNGMATRGYVIPVGGTFLVFSDFLRPAIRMAALQNIQSIFVLSHDSIGVGEDGPTHQPIEHMASLSLIPNLNVLRPADGIETLEAWQVALQDTNRPTALLLCRQNLPTLRSSFNLNCNLVAKGGYVLACNNKEGLINVEKTPIKDLPKSDINLIASGSELSLAFKVSEKLASSGISSRLISMPSLGLFKDSGKDYIEQTIGQTKLNIIIEAGVIGDYSDVIFGSNTCIKKFGLTTFGKSGKAEEVYQEFGLTENNIYKEIIKLLN